MSKPYMLIAFIIGFLGCVSHKKNDIEKPTFGYAASFLQRYQQTIILTSDDSLQKVLICPNYQARVMTSTAEGNKGTGFGWINYDFIEKQAIVPHINPYGGEERIWFGPEGGQYSLFFKKDSDFIFDNWQVPAIMDTEPYKLSERSSQSASFYKNVNITNYSGFAFKYLIKRKISMLTEAEIINLLLGSYQVKVVGYQSENTITNMDTTAWTKKTGLISIWIMGMFKASDKTLAMFPVTNDSKLENINDRYFHKPDTTRLKIKNDVVSFKTDGKYRSKIGIPFSNAQNVIGSYSPESNTLTIIFYNKPQIKSVPYVNSLWEKQNDPYTGDVVNAYNDGPNKKITSDKNSFYELETSSPALELKPNEQYTHIHKTIHIQGTKTELESIAKKVLGVQALD